MKRLEIVIDILIIVLILVTALVLAQDVLLKCFLGMCGVVVLFNQFVLLQKAKPKKKKEKKNKNDNK